MNPLQKHLLHAALLLTGLILVLDQFFLHAPWIWILKFFVIFTIFLGVLLVPVATTPKRRVGFVLFFAVLGDAFLYLPLAAASSSPWVHQGMASFILAYYLLNRHYLRQYPGRMIPWRIPLGAVLVLAAAGFPLLRTLAPLSALLLLLLLLALLRLLLTAWTRDSARKAAQEIPLLRLSASLMVLCDFGVALGLLLPYPGDTPYRWGVAVVWGAYLMAWALLPILLLFAPSPVGAPSMDQG